MSAEQVHGVQNNADLNPGLIQRDTRPLRFRIHDFVADTGGFILIMLGVIVTLWPFVFSVQVFDVLFIIGILFAWYAWSKHRSYPFRRPIAQSGDGLMYFGNDRQTDAGLWFSNDDARTHMLVFGSTGSGKTRFLLGIFYQAMLIGSGAIYVDGKGDNTVWWLAFSLCRRLGREDDLLVMNYLTGTGEDTNRITNSNNPFAYGNAEQLRSLVVGLMRESGGGDAMWKGRASAMLGGLLKALTTLRDRGELELDIATIRAHIPLDKIIMLALRNDLPESALKPLQGYLAELPGYSEIDAAQGALQQKCYEQHGYLAMQLTEVMADLTDTYGHIFGFRRGEIDFKDVVFNRRLLFVMLPALEKDPDALAGLGKLVVAGVRSALAPALGNAVAGTRREAVEQKPSNAKVPFIIILDEYGYYAVKGFAVVAAQARSLGVSVVFAGQDYPSFKRASEEEAASVQANTNIKIFMKLEDPKETFDIAQARGGEAKATLTSGYEAKGAAGLYADQKTARIDSMKRVNLRDLTSQKPGQAHVINGDTISRAQLFYADPFEVPEIKLNEFLQIENVPKHVIDQINEAFKRFEQVVEKGGLGALDADDEARGPSQLDPGLKTIFADLALVGERGLSGHEAAVVALGLSEVREQIEDYEAEVVAGLRTDEPAETPAARIEPKPSPASAKRGAEKRAAGDAGRESPHAAPEHPVRAERFADERQMVLLEDAHAPERSVRPEATRRAEEFEALLSGIVLRQAEASAGRPLTVAERADAAPRSQLEASGARAGLSREESAEEAASTLETLGESLRYPAGPVPEKIPQEEIAQTLKELLKLVDEQSQF
ncbi:intracellular multiplication protein IcmO [Natronocella acetinitrilica]|uniref:Intracellular multiplication protein IcmO n=1 Tax=Natronocella acetinitrilica TaxID=414046 RepID=A0AAE3G2E6_9GAMM|nr:TraM recognition domain-containing protein [Natronocella acetinitrilica]MCP1674162.1 intracellular multiplication protein IcmO [Natronocella acetinitrilica]